MSGAKTRYDNLLEALDQQTRATKHLRLLEIGTYDGTRAAQLITHWLGKRSWWGRRTIEYFGYDLFEDMTPDRNVAELSKAKLPPSRDTVRQKLAAIAGATAELHKGDTRKTLADTCGRMQPMHVIFQDGGHSLETVDSDWRHASRLMTPQTIYLFDDYYENREDFGCKKLVKALQANPRYEVTLLDPVDHYPHTQLSIRMAQVRLKAA